MKNNRDYLLDMLDYIGKIERFTNTGRDDFYNDERTQMAVIRAYEVIGEIAKRLPDALLETQTNIPWKTIKGFRDFLAHHYEEVLIDIVWVAVEDLPNLRTAVEAMLDSLSKDE